MVSDILLFLKCYSKAHGKVATLVTTFSIFSFPYFSLLLTRQLSLRNKAAIEEVEGKGEEVVGVIK